MALKRVGVQGMSPKELAALNQWAEQMRKSAPVIAEMGRTAKAIHTQMLNSPVWRIVEGRPEAGRERPTEVDPLSIGAPKVNYVDHIETAGDSHESPTEKGQQ